MTSLQVLWAATDGSRYIWREIVTQGTPPTPRFHHSCDTYDGRLLSFVCIAPLWLLLMPVESQQHGRALWQV